MSCKKASNIVHTDTATKGIGCKQMMLVQTGELKRRRLCSDLLTNVLPCLLHTQ